MPIQQQQKTRNLTDAALWFITLLVVLAAVYAVSKHYQTLIRAGVPLTTASALKMPSMAVREAAYHEVGRLPTGFIKSRALAVEMTPAGSICYVAGDQGIREIDHLKTERELIRLEHAPQCLAAAGKTLFIGFQDHVEVWSTGGKRLNCWVSPGRQACLTSLAVRGDNVWVADAGNRLVYYYNRAGKLRGSVGKADTARGVPGLVVPSPHLDVAIGTDGLMRVTNPGRHTIETYSPEGRLRGSWGKAADDLESFCGCCNPTDIALFPDGRIVTAEKGLARVKIYRSNGVFAALVAGPESFAYGDAGLDLAIAPGGRVLVLDPAANAVRIFAPGKKTRTHAKQ